MREGGDLGLGACIGRTGSSTSSSKCRAVVIIVVSVEVILVGLLAMIQGGIGRE